MMFALAAQRAMNGNLDLAQLHGKAHVRNLNTDPLLLTLQNTLYITQESVDFIPSHYFLQADPP